MGAWIVALMIFVLFTISFMSLANHSADAYDTEIEAEYNETFNELDRLSDLAYDLDASGGDDNESSVENADQTESKLKFAWNVVTRIPSSINIGIAMLDVVANKIGIPRVFVEVAGSILIVLISLAILSIFLKSRL